MNNGCIITVPAKSLGVRDYNMPTKDGEEPKMIEPQAGDPVDFSIKGSVTAIDGAGNATVHIAFVNGQRVETPAAPEPEKPAELDEEGVRAMAAEADGPEAYL